MTMIIPKKSRHAPAFRILQLAILFVVGVSGCEGCRPSQGNFAFIGFSDVPPRQTATLTS